MLSLIILFCSGLSENHEMNSQQEIAIGPNHKNSSCQTPRIANLQKKIINSHKNFMYTVGERRKLISY